MENKKTQSFYHPELDGLRFIAFLLVFIHNSPYLESSPVWTAIHEYGWIGVDLFFCLSAFLITKLLTLEYKQSGSINVRNFYIRRSLRIWPLYFIYIVIALLFSYEKLGWENLDINLMGLITFTFNFMFIFLSPRVIVLFIHLWTISYEEQFYFVIPWILRKSMSAKANFGLVFLLAALLLGSSTRALFIIYHVKHPAIYMLPFTHFEAVLLGIATGMGLFDRMFMKIQGWILLFFGVLFNIAVFLLPNTYEITWKLMLTYPLSGLGMALIIYALIYKEKLMILSLLKSRALIYLGKISYGLYIYHIISLSIVNDISIRIFKVTPSEHPYYPISLFFSGLSLTIFLAIISYIWIEKPFLKFKQRFSLINFRPL